MNLGLGGSGGIRGGRAKGQEGRERQEGQKRKDRQHASKSVSLSQPCRSRSSCTVGLTVKLASRTIRADVAFGGAFYAIVDSEAVGLPIDAAHVPELRRVGMEIIRAIDAAHAIVHPLDPGLNGIYGTIFTGPPNGDQTSRLAAQRDDLRRREREVDQVAVRHPARPR